MATDVTGGRERLIRAAIALVADQGLTSLTYRSLAARAGVTHGAVQHHFHSIDDVLLSAMAWSVETSLRDLDAATAPSDFIANVRGSVEAGGEIEAFQYQVALASRNREGIRPLVLELYQAYWESTARALSTGGATPDRAIVRAIYATAEGILYEHAVLGVDDHDDTELAIEGLRRLMELALQSAGTLAPVGGVGGSGLEQ